MKKLFYLAVLGFTFSCSDNKTNTTTTESTPVTPAADNVNGNIPDSTNNIKLNQQLPVDSSHLRDSTR
jgi:hypothetical protein